MNSEAQRIAIAEACPTLFWVHKGRSGNRPWSRIFRLGEHPAYGDRECDPLNDLNAMHEAEKVLTDGDQKHKYASLIGRHDYWTLLHATAAQRTEAFLKTLGKWEDS